MLRSVRWALVAVFAVPLLAVGVGVAAPDKAELKVAKDAVDKMVGGTAPKEIGDVKKTTSSEAIMALLDIAKVGGYGHPMGKDNVSIEYRLTELAKKGIAPADLDKEQKDLILSLERIKAVTELNEQFTPAKKVGNKDPKDWTKSNGEVRKGTADLIEAVKAKDTKKIQAIAKALEGSCTACHNVFK